MFGIGSLSESVSIAGEEISSARTTTAFHFRSTDTTQN